MSFSVNMIARIKTFDHNLLKSFYQKEVEKIQSIRIHVTHD